MRGSVGWRYFDPNPNILRKDAKISERLIFDADRYADPESVRLKLKIRISNPGLYFLSVQARGTVYPAQQRRAQTQTISRLR